MIDGMNRNTLSATIGLPVGAKLGKYEIVERLGSGGEAIVYKGFDPLLERYVAIRQLAPQLASEERLLARFREVIRQLAKLNCEQVVTIFELIEDATAGVFVVMEFVEGHNIETILSTQPGPVEVKAVLQTIWRLAAGLAAIHKAGIIHRDIKPANIIVGEGLRVKITDFGVAAKAGTPTSMRLGTTKYMAPELFAGTGIDGRVDIYSLGMITYEMLVGRSKFNEIFHDLVRDPHSEALRWMKWHNSPEQVAPPANEANPAVPPALTAIVAKMMAKDPAQRYANVEMLGRDIRLSFSARQKASAPGRAARRPRGPVGIEAPRPAAASMLEMDDDLAVPATAEAAGPATAPIPGRSLKDKLKSVSLGVWVSIAAVLVVFTVGGLVLQQMSKNAKAKIYRGEAEAAYASAMADYENGAKPKTPAGKPKTLADKQRDYQSALDSFTAVQKAYQMKVPGIGDKSWVMGRLSHAYVYIVTRDFEQADQCLKSVSDKLTDYQRERPDLMEWVQAVPQQQLRTLQGYRDQQNLFVKYMEEANAAVDKNDLEAALDVINRKLIKENVAVSREEEGIVEKLQRKIQEMQKQEEYRALIKKGDALADKDVNAAIKLYDQALVLIEGSKETLPNDVYIAFKRMAELKKARLQNKMKYAVAVAAANKATGSPDVQAAANQLRQAAGVYDEMAKTKLPADQLKELRDITDPAALRKRADDLEFNYWLEKARTDLAGTRDFQVLKDLENCEKFRPGSPEAKLIAAAVTGRANYATLVASGQKLFSQGKWEEARTALQQALRINPSDKDVITRLVECNYRLAVEQGESCRRKGDFAGATQFYTQAVGFKPTAKAEMDARIEQMRTEQTVTQLMTAGKTAMANSKWGEGRNRFLDVVRIQPGNKEAAKLINVCWYEEFMAQGRDSTKIADHNSAHAYYMQALNKIKNDDPAKAAEAEKQAEQADQLRKKADKEGSTGG